MLEFHNFGHFFSCSHFCIIITMEYITPKAELHLFRDFIDERTEFELWSYPIETVLAEKVETILSRGVDNTRPRDFYDVYMLSSSEYDKESFKSAFQATASHRESLEKINDINEIVLNISDSVEMNKR